MGNIANFGKHLVYQKEQLRYHDTVQPLTNARKLDMLWGKGGN